MSDIDKEIEDAKDYLIRGLNGVVKRQADSIAELEAENANLLAANYMFAETYITQKAERDELRNRLIEKDKPDGFKTWEEYHKHIVEVKAGNAKLRKDLSDQQASHQKTFAELKRLQAAHAATLETLRDIDDHALVCMGHAFDVDSPWLYSTTQAALAKARAAQEGGGAW